MGFLINPYAFGYSPPPTSYANAGGSGNRAGVVTVTINAFTLGGGSAGAFVNGTTTGAEGFWFSGAMSAGNIAFDFGSAKYVDELKWYQSSTPTAIGTWQVEGSNDNSDWTALGSTFALGGTSSQTVSVVHAVPAAYRYYRLKIVSGSTSAAAWNNEIEFKIG